MPTNTAYQAFGLTINSQISLQPLVQLDTIIATPDISISIGNVSEEGLDQPNATYPFCQAAADELWLNIPDIARFHISRGSHIIVEPAANADLQSVKLYLLGSCLGAIMYQRHRLVIHGNAIRIGDECVIFAGVSGAGKSTLAGAFQQRGYQVLADDLAVIDEQGLVHPAYPQLKLWQDSTQKLALDNDDLDRIRLQISKFAVPIRDGFCDTALPVRAVYILNSHNEDTFELDTLTGMDKLNPLKHNSYRRLYAEGMGLKKQHFAQCSKLAATIAVKRITRPNAGFKLDELVDFILQDLNQDEQQGVA